MFASLTSTFPQIIWLSSVKLELFIVTGMLLAISFYFIKKSESMPCPPTKEQGELCESTKTSSKTVLYFTSGIYVLGLMFAYILPAILF